MSTPNYQQAYIDLFRSGILADGTIAHHIERYAALDAIAPAQASFFYLIEPAVGAYHFVGKQQQMISGVDNDAFVAGGIKSFLDRVHPEDVPIIINEIYPDFTSWFQEHSSDVPIEDMFFQYNYRFRNLHEHYCSLMEHVYIPEIDPQGEPSLLLGNVILLGTGEQLPIKASINVYRQEIVETLKRKSYSTIGDSYQLTVRELDILKNLARGKKSKEIATNLFISPHTVDTHRRSLLKKMHCASVVEMARIAYKSGLI